MPKCYKVVRNIDKRVKMWYSKGGVIASGGEAISKYRLPYRLQTPRNDKKGRINLFLCF